MSDEDTGFLDAQTPEETAGHEQGWLDCPRPPTKLPSDPKAKVLAVTAYLEECHLSLADVAKLHPKWFYTQFLKPLLPKESKIEVSGEVLTDVQLDARIQHLVGVLGPEALAKYVGTTQALVSANTVVDMLE